MKNIVRLFEFIVGIALVFTIASVLGVARLLGCVVDLDPFQNFIQEGRS